MSSVILNVTFDCSQPAVVARFWAEATRWPLHVEDPLPGHEEYSVGPPVEGGIRLYFVGVPEPKTARNRIHLDVIPQGNQHQEIARLLALGASVADQQPEDVPWVIMSDPEGNEFCVEPGTD